MRIAILGYGKEGQSAEKFFQLDKAAHEIQVIDNFTKDELKQLDLSSFGLVMRSPSVPPYSDNWSSVTKYFFAHCPCPIIGITGTKGKGTTCSMVTAILKELQYTTWLVGNIGTPALDVLRQVRASDVVIYELSSFQLWDLDRSPHIAAILRVEPDHLNIHETFENYTNAKSNIVRWQKKEDTCIYYSPNSESMRIAKLSPGHHLSYPITERSPLLDEILDKLIIPGAHNRENAEAALLVVASFLNLSLNDFLAQFCTQISAALHKFKGLPHRIEFLRELNGVSYYDDTFSTTPPALKVALQAFPGCSITPIIGGRDKTNNADLPEIAELILQTPKLTRAVLIGESGHDLAKILPPERFILAETLTEAIAAARKIAENTNDAQSVVIMSPTAASFDMFKNEFDRGEQYQNLIRGLQ